jgi:hypothetical protein
VIVHAFEFVVTVPFFVSAVWIVGATHSSHTK